MDRINVYFSEYEAPTWLLIVLTYGAWLGLTYFASHIPLVLALVVGGYVVCLHGSLQHEVVHGHPTRWQFLNTAAIWWPLSLWMPYVRYRDLHRAHHACETLTDPDADTESYYFRPEQWLRLSRLQQVLLNLNQTLLGRLIAGPFIAVVRYWRRDWDRIVSGDRRVLKIWFTHLLGVAVVLYWVMGVCDMSLLYYVGVFALPGLSLTLLRSYTEHRPGSNNRERTAIIEGGPLTRLLFLNNNYHLIHHDQPGLPWFRIRSVYEAEKARWGELNNGFHFRSYVDLFRRFAFSAKDHAVV